jgi:hypothetical protein
LQSDSDLSVGDPSSSEDRDAYYASGCHSPFQAIVPKADCAGGDPAGRATIALIGDSKAAQWFFALDTVALKRRWRLLAYTKSGCPALLIPNWFPYSSTYGAYAECDEWTRLLDARLAADRPDYVLLSFSHAYVHPGFRPLAPTEWRAGLRGFAARLRASGARPALLLDTPQPEFSVPACLAHCGGESRRCALLRSGVLNGPARAALVAAAREEGLPVVDPAGWFCAPEPSPSPPQRRPDCTACAEATRTPGPADSGQAPVGDGRGPEPSREAIRLEGGAGSAPDAVPGHPGGPAPPSTAVGDGDGAEGDLLGDAEQERRAPGWEDGACPAVIGGVPVYQDAMHVTVGYARRLAGVLGDALPW